MREPDRNAVLNPSTGCALPRVLIIEDNPLQRDVYTKLLYYNGFDVDFAADAESGLRIAVENPLDAILVDVILPAMNGLEAISILKSNPATAHVPVIAFSAYDVDMHNVKRSGADDFVAKPLTGDVLVRAIRRFIGWGDVESARDN